MSFLARTSVAILLAGGVCTAASPQTPVREALPPLDPQTLQDWVAAVVSHRPGEQDAGLATIAAWPHPKVAGVIRDACGLAKALAASNGHGASDKREVKFASRVFTAAFLETLFRLTGDDLQAADASAMLFRAALLDTDIAMDTTGTPSAAGSTALQVVDGQVVAVARRSEHWGLARQLLDCTTPTASHVDLNRRWYEATGAYQSNTLDWSNGTTHLDRARQLFPDDPRILLLIGVMHEVFAMPAIQLVQQEQELRRAAYLRAFNNPVVGAKSIVDASPVELRTAETLFRQVVTISPDLAEARLHLGRVVGLLGKHDEAVRELTKVIDAPTDRTLRYYAALFLGQEFSAIGDRDAARANFDRAATLYPTAQAPLLGLSHLAREAGDSQAAVAAFLRMAELPADVDQREDPWWTYDRSHVRDADKLLADVSKLFASQVVR